MPAKISPALKKRAAGIKLFLCDVDGVLTDGSSSLDLPPDKVSFFLCKHGFQIESSLTRRYATANPLSAAHVCG
jgi:3-deoxy-D-manno-octulosonate 8-phosphate phosphatase KdsC-like HAD superfamily phosphatase